MFLPVLSQPKEVYMKKMILKKSAIALSVLALSGSMAFAATDSASDAAASKTDSSAAQALINNISKGQLETLNTFAGPGDLTGFVLQPKGGSPMIMYAANDGSYAVYGNVIGADGQSISDADKQKYVDAYIAKNILTYLPETVSFTQGSADAPYQITAMADPNCSACNYFYKVAKPAIDSGQLRVNWILVAFVQPDSEAKAISIMTSDDPAAAMEANESGFDPSTEEGGAKAATNITEEQKAALQKNMDFMRNAGLGSTPTVMFYDRNGEFKFVKGSPRDMTDFIKQYGPTDKPAADSAS